MLSLGCNFSANISLQYALLLFSHIPSPDAFLANILLRALDPSAALFFYTHLVQSSLIPTFDAHTFPLLLKACSQTQSLSVAKMVHSQALKLGLASLVSIQNALVQTYASCGSITSARLAFDGIRDFDDASLSIMVGGYVKCGCFEDAQKLLDGMAKRDVVSWSVMINWYVQGSLFSEGLKLFRKMLAEKLQSNESIFVNVLSTCANIGSFKQGRWVEDYARRKNVALTVR